MLNVNHFRSCTHRWDKVSKSLGSMKELKRLSETRGSARTDAVSALDQGNNQIRKALTPISDNNDERLEMKPLVCQQK